MWERLGWIIALCYQLAYIEAHHRSRQESHQTCWCWGEKFAFPWNSQCLQSQWRKRQLATEMERRWEQAYAYLCMIKEITIKRKCILETVLNAYRSDLQLHHHKLLVKLDEIIWHNWSCGSEVHIPLWFYLPITDGWTQSPAKGPTGVHPGLHNKIKALWAPEGSSWHRTQNIWMHNLLVHN